MVLDIYQLFTVIIVLNGILLVWVILLTWRLMKRNSSTLANPEVKDLANVETRLVRLHTKQQKLEDFYKELKKSLSEQKLKQRSMLARMGLIRFNPFNDTGGEQSFSLALLNDMDSGVVITSLHSRDITRWYVKPIVSGSSPDFPLTDEEKKVVAKAHDLGT